MRTMCFLPLRRLMIWMASVLEDGHLLGSVRAAVAVDGDLAGTSPVGRNVPVLGVGCWVHAGLFLGEKVESIA